MSEESSKEEILINVTPREVRAALLENGILQEVFVERAARRGLISNIYKGKVSRVLPGMQAAFVDIGLSRTAFLHASDIVRPGTRLNGNGHDEVGEIRDLVREGEDVLVQVVKDPLGTKGARLTTFITLPSRFLVLMPMGEGVGVSARIEDEEERERLRSEVQEILDTVTRLTAVSSCAPRRKAPVAMHCARISPSCKNCGPPFRSSAGKLR